MQQSDLKSNSWEASKAFGDKIELEFCKEFIEKTYAYAMKSLEHVPYDPKNPMYQKDYGDWRLTLKSKQIYYIESKGRARETNDLCVEVRMLDGKYRLRHLYTDKLYYYTSNNDPMFIDVPILRELVAQNDDWQKYVIPNRKGDTICMYIPFNVVIPAYHKKLGMMMCG